MKIISEELKRVEELINNINGKIYQSREYKDDLEWWVLGKISGILKKYKMPYPVYAEKKTPPDPDFKTYDNSRIKFKYIEITEVLDPDRRRSDEYKRENPYNEIILADEPNIELLHELKKRIKSKLLKIYGTDTWLFIYFDISYSHLLIHGYWHRMILTNIRSWKEKNEINLNDQIYERIFITNSSAKSLVMIYPKIQIIKPENI